MTTRRGFLQTLGVAAQSGPHTATRPNILLVMTDQHRAGLTRGSGFALDTMPAVDRLASGGVGFDRAYATAPLCVPSRVSMLTGRWPHAHRIRENAGVNHVFFEKDLFQIARENGYRIGLAGKNHSHVTPERLDFCRLYSHAGGWKAPNATAAIHEYDAWLANLNSHLSEKPSPFPLEAQLPYRIVSDASEFLDNAGQQPFLLWVSFPEPHPPYQTPQPYYDMFPPETVPTSDPGPEALAKKSFKYRWFRALQEYVTPGSDEQERRMQSVYLGTLRLIDDQIGRLLTHLERRKLLANTIVIFTADHGDYFGEYGLWRKGVEMPESLIRIPMIWSGWGIKGGNSRHQAHVSNADIMPTLCEAMGTPLPKGTQGRSLWPLLTGRAYPQEEFRSVYAEVGIGGLHYDERDNPSFEIALTRREGSRLSFDGLNEVTQSGFQKMVRMGDWKLLFDMMGAGQLYNLAVDPYELNNRYGDPAVAVHQMRLLEELLTWNIRTQDSLPTARYRTKWAERNWYAPYRRR